MNGYTTNSGRIVIGRYDSAAVFHVENSPSEGLLEHVQRSDGQAGEPPFVGEIIVPEPEGPRCSVDGGGA